jgi:uncharacterized protein
MERGQEPQQSQKTRRGFRCRGEGFSDPFLLLIVDRIEEGEQRWHAIGAAEAAILLVVHVYRTESEYGEEEITRIISARPANKSERRRYFDQAAQ